MSNEKRPSTLLNYSFSSKKLRTDTENWTPSWNLPATTRIRRTNDHSNLILSSDSEYFDQVNDEVNSGVENIELKVTNCRFSTNRNDINYYLLNKLSIDDHLKYFLLTNPLKPWRKYSFPTLYSADHKYSRQFLINLWLNDNSFPVYSSYIEGSYFIHYCNSLWINLFMDTNISKISLDHWKLLLITFSFSWLKLIDIIRFLVEKCNNIFQ